MKKNILGWVILFAAWYVITALELINPEVLPSPMKTWEAFLYILRERDLSGNVLFSLKINFMGYIMAIGLALPVGFMFGLFKSTRELFSNPVNSLRFVPITALGGIFIAISGLTIWTKINFLAFGIWVYLVPVVVQRIAEVSNTHLQMMQTLGATKWQMFKHLQWKYVVSRLSDDIRILVGISWTYIIVAELKNVEGGLGSMVWLGERQSNMGIVYSVLIIIVIIGILQDWSFKAIDKVLFKFKHL